jgi:energy-coupling factor transport system ATP-binding protein
MLALERVTYRYAGATTRALTDVSVALGDGEVVGICGASEAGKTTVCLVAAGIAPRAIRGEITGRLLIDGRDVAGLPMHELITSVGVCFSDPTTQLSGVCSTVYEEIAFGPMNLGLPRSEVLSRTEAALDTMAIGAIALRDPARLSGGQMQLVAIAGLLALGPRTLILDEPTAELDPAGSRLVAEAIGRLTATGASILMAEQRTDLLAGLCDRIVVLDGGRIALEGPAADVLADERLETLGVAAPSAVRLRRAFVAAGLDPRWLDDAAATAGPR